MFWGLRGTVCPYWLCYKQLVWQFVWSVIHKEHQASCGEEGLSPRAWSVCSHTRHTHTHTHKHTSQTSQKAQQCEHWPVWEAGLHGAHGRLHGHFSWRLVLPVLLVTEEKEASQLLTPRGQKSWKESRGRACQGCRSPVRNNCRGNSAPLQALQKACKNWLCGKKRAEETTYEQKLLSRFGRKIKKQWPDWHTDAVFFAKCFSESCLCMELKNRIDVEYFTSCNYVTTQNISTYYILKKYKM